MTKTTNLSLTCEIQEIQEKCRTWLAAKAYYLKTNHHDSYTFSLKKGDRPEIS